MTNATAMPPTMQDLMARVGYVLLYWGYAEQELDRAIGRLQQADARSERPLPPETNHLFGPRLRHWRELQVKVSSAHPYVLAQVEEVVAQLKAASLTRNHLCHGLRVASVETGEEARVTCVLDHYPTATDGGPPENAVYGCSELDHVVTVLEQARRDIEAATHWALEVRKTAARPTGDR